MNQPSLYAKHKGLQQRDAIFVVENYFNLVKWKGGSESVMDVGCGDGQITVEILLPQLPVNVEKIIGSDVSENMVQFAKNKYTENGNVDFVQLDISTDRLPEQFHMKFDHIFSFYCLHWIRQQRNAFKNIYNMLTSDGDILLVFLASNPIYDIYEKLSKYQKWEQFMRDWETYVSPYHKSSDPEKDLELLLKETGFNSHVCKIIDRSYTFPNYEVVKKSVRAISPFIGRLPENEADNFIDDYVSELQTTKNVEIERIENEEKIHCHYKLFVVYASKSLDLLHTG